MNLAKALFLKWNTQDFLQICIFLLTANTLAANNLDKVFTTEDAIYEESIKTVLLYTTNPDNFQVLDMLAPPIVHISQGIPLKLEFDELGSQYQNYFLKIINCNADWATSQLNSIQYLDNYNEYQISQKQLSYNTRSPYVHYEIFLPKVKISGNYLAMVYRESDDQDFVLTKRFVVYSNPLAINIQPKFPVNIADRNNGQQIDFTINYSQLNVINPLQSLKVVVRQNYRWHNSITQLKPSFIDETSQSLQYLFYNGENVFRGSNEYRYFDIRSNRFKGLGVAKATYDAAKTEITLVDDFNRSAFPYSLLADFDGRYMIQNYETGDSEIQPDYVYVTFVLNSPKVEGNVYVIGGMNNWREDRNSLMTYNTAINKYIYRTLLKQGQYNYAYSFQAPGQASDEVYFEGSYSIAENWYDILVYYRPPGTLSDQVIGYSSIDYQGR